MPHRLGLGSEAVTLCGNLASSRTIMLVHGFGSDRNVWSELARSLKRDYRLVLLDNAGSGKAAASFQPNRHLSLKAYARDIIGLCESLGLRGITLVGHSAGAMMCLLAAVERPELFSKLVMISASPRYLDDGNYHGGFTQPDIDSLYEEASQRYEDWAEGFARQMMGAPDQPALAQRFAEDLKSIPPEQALTVLCSILQSDHRQELPKLTVPTLLINSSKDLAVPLSVAHYMQRHIPRSQLRVVEGEGHLPHLSAPDQILAALRDFGL